ncbi:non-hydrolyzing UDP-N-acetylglucosamine 2-epimerase [Planctomycetota bacterium]
MPKTILSILGTRPQFVKAAAFSRALKDDAGERLREIIIHTGQHFDATMSEVFLNQLSIPKPACQLAPKPDVGRAQRMAYMTHELEGLIRKYQPDMVVITGDTDSAAAGAQAARAEGIILAHIESGLRVYDFFMPEEINRVLADSMSDLLFVSSKTAADNLSKEKVQGRIVHSGDIMLDTLYNYLPHIPPVTPLLKLMKLRSQKYFILTLHRAELVENSEMFARAIGILNRLSSKKFPVLFPVHPRTAAALQELPEADRKNLHCIAPVPYLDMLSLLGHAEMILTDSGGLQKEAYWLKTPCITVRKNTEWVETLISGWNILCDPAEDEFEQQLQQAIARPKPGKHDTGLYGTGSAGKKIVQAILQYL